MKNKKIFILDDSQTFTKLLSFMIKKRLDMECIISYTFSDAREVLEKEGENIFAAILDLNLPDSPGIEHIDYLINEKIPTIVLTGDFNDEIREKIFANKRIVDYALKTRREDMEYVLSLLFRLQKNKEIKIVVVDDSTLYRKLTSDLLETHLFQVFAAKNGFECMEILEKHKDVKMVLTDYDMPGMDGFTLTSLIRENYSKDLFSIIGVSANETKNISSRFIKFGVNDFIGKPFSKEEFFCRINMNLDILENFKSVRELANNDFLTKIYNRRYFFNEAGKFFDSPGKPIVISMLDIDYFKKINDTYGHESGDKALICTANLLNEITGDKGLIARFGGEEFAIASLKINPDEIEPFFESIRAKISEMNVKVSETEFLNITISIGVYVTFTQNKTLSEVLNIADSCLYQAKSSGRNKVIIKKD